MTDRIKNIRSPKWILLSCENAKKISELVSGILNHCSYNACVNDFSENTDFIITNNTEIPKSVYAETIFFDESSELPESVLEKFYKKVLSYEYACKRYSSDFHGVKTYSESHYSADVTCRNISVNSDRTVFDIIHGGILGRVRIKNSAYTVEDVLLCTAVLTATGIPLASVIEYFNCE